MLIAICLLTGKQKDRKYEKSETIQRGKCKCKSNVCKLFLIEMNLTNV